MRSVIPATIAFLLSIVGAHGQQQTSALWGAHGEKYDPAGLLPDFSFAGYERGEKPIPERAPAVSVKSFGAAGDGKADDTAAFKRALKEAAGQVIGIPPGRYLLSDVLEITTPDTVLKGAGPDKTVLVETQPLQTLKPTTDKTGDGKETTKWSWAGGLVVFKDPGAVREVLAHVAAPGAKRGETCVPVDDAARLQVGQAVVIEARDSDGSFVRHLFRDHPQDSAALVGRLGYRYIARILDLKDQRVTLDRPLRFDVRPEWAAACRAYTPTVTQSGIEDLAFEFPRAPYRGHWEEDGFNAIEFQKCSHCWARRLRIHNSDSGIYFDADSFFCTASDLLFTANRPPEHTGRTGHHGVQMMGADHLCTRFHFKTRFFHELTVSGSLGCVFSDGDGEELTLDHHKFASYENLFTSLDAGKGGPAMWNSGGPPGVGQHSAAGATFWNIRSREKPGLPQVDRLGVGFGPPGLVFIGLKGGLRTSELHPGWHYEPIYAGSLTPTNLHLAQLGRRLAAAGAMAGGAAPLRWTTAAGQAFQAKFGGVEGANVIFMLQDGRRAPYPFASLSADSRACVTKLANAGTHLGAGATPPAGPKASTPPSPIAAAGATSPGPARPGNADTAAEQIRRFVQHMQALNPDFDGKVDYKASGDSVVELSFSPVAVKDLAPVAELKALETLVCHASWTKPGLISDLAPLQGLPLKELCCDHSPVSDLAPLKGMKLKKLNCAGTKITDLRPLAGMALERLECYSTGIRDLSPLTGMPLTGLLCARTEVSDLSPLQGLPLHALYCPKTKVTDLSLLKTFPLDVLECDFVPARDATLIRAIPTLRRINGLPAEEFWKRVDAGEAPQAP